MWEGLQGFTRDGLVFFFTLCKAKAQTQLCLDSGFAERITWL